MIDLIVNIILGLLGGFIGGFILLHLEIKNQARIRHFDALKREVLTQVYEILGYIKMGIDRIVVEDTHFADLDLFVSRQVDWAKSFSLKKETIYLPLASKECKPSSSAPSISANPILYDDIKNHFEELAKIYDELDKVMREDYSNFVYTFKQLYTKIRNELRIRLTANKWDEDKDYNRIFESSVNVIFLSIIGKDEHYWPNAYNFLKEKSDWASEVRKTFPKEYLTPLEIIKKVLDDLNTRDSVKEFRELRQKVLSLLSKAEEETLRWIHHEGKLPGKCKYL